MEFLPLQGLFYIPDFLTPEEAAAVVHAIDAAPQHRWVAAGERRLQNWGGRPGSQDVTEVNSALISNSQG